MISRTAIATAIRTLGLEGRSVCIHSSMRSFGMPVEGGPRALLEAFLQMDCTVMVPAFSDMYETPPVAAYMPPQNGAGDYSYFYAKAYENIAPYTPQSDAFSIEDMGVFVRAVLATPGRCRGSNPLNSFAAVGPLAEMIAGCQTEREVYAPFDRLYEQDGFVLLIGVGLECATAIHYAEQRAGRNPFVRWSSNAQGNTIPVMTGGCSEGFGHLAPCLAPWEQQCTVGSSLWRCYPVRQLVDACAEAIRNDPSITHCGDPDCARCNDARKGGPILPPDFF